MIGQHSTWGYNTELWLVNTQRGVMILSCDWSISTWHGHALMMMVRTPHLRPSVASVSINQDWFNQLLASVLWHGGRVLVCVSSSLGGPHCHIEAWLSLVVMPGSLSHLLFSPDQSEISICLCQPMRSEYYLVTCSLCLVWTLSTSLADWS